MTANHSSNREYKTTEAPEAPEAGAGASAAAIGVSITSGVEDTLGETADEVVTLTGAVVLASL